MACTKLLRQMREQGRAFVYKNNTWKVRVTICLCSPDEIAETVKEMTGSDEASPYGLSGFSITSVIGKRSNGVRHYLMWVDNRFGFRTIAALCHEAVHISGLVLSDCGVSVNLKDISASECLAYLVEDIVQFSLPKLDWKGLDTSVLENKEE